MTRVAVFGTGSWGTAYAAVLADAGSQVRLWGRRVELVERINSSHVNDDYLPDLVLPEAVSATTDAQKAVEGVDIVVLAVPSQTLRVSLALWADLIPPGAAVVSLMKGVELGTTKRMSEVIAEVAGVDLDRIAVVSGPNLAREIAAKQPAATVVASIDESLAERVALACAAPYFRPYTNTDVVGTELGGAVKNVIALAVGMAEGMGMGDNTKSTIITRGLAETVRLGVALGADPATFSGLAGIGDLIATCMSPLSRNFAFGVNLGRGMSVAEVKALSSQTAEGVNSCQAILELAHHHGIDVPIIENVAAVIHKGRAPDRVADTLMSRARKAETI
ncbi:MAG: NAD(P)H-dependent glycerol-3-phosphate dehydrogenase [Dermatophilaceae bacterium]